MLGRFGELFSKKLQKVAHFSKKNEKSSIWPKLATFWGNSHVSAYWSTFQQKVAKSSSFRENARKIIDFAKTCNFSRKLPCLGVLVNFSAKSCKKWLISSRSTKNHRFAQNLQLFDETTMFRRFGLFSGKSCRKGLISLKSTKNHGFGQNLKLFEETTMFRRFGQFFSKKLQKVAHFVKKNEKSSIWPKLTTSRTNYHVSAFGQLFSKKL